MHYLNDGLWKVLCSPHASLLLTSFSVIGEIIALVVILLLDEVETKQLVIYSERHCASTRKSISKFCFSNLSFDDDEAQMFPLTDGTARISKIH